MRRILSVFFRPCRFVLLVALVVFSGAIFLWCSMQTASRDAFDADGSIIRGLVSMHTLAYEEPFDTPLEDAAKHADMALNQAMLRSAITLDATALEKIELRQSPNGPYHFQRIRLAVGDDPLPFLTHFRESLEAWASGAEIARSGMEEGNSVWTISVMGVVTHELVLQPGKQPSIARNGKEVPEHQGPGRILRRRDPGESARLVIVMDDIGEDMAALRSLLRLPFTVTCAVWPRSTHARRAAETANAAGREVIIHQPTEPMKYPEMNPGPGALFVSMPDGVIEKIVRESITRVPHAAGMNNHMGSRFTRDKRAAAAMLRPLKDVGFFALDSMTHPGSVLHKEATNQDIPVLKRDIFLDTDPSKENVLRQLRKAEKVALVTGQAIAIGHPLPGTLAALKDWDSFRNPQVEIVRLSDLFGL